MHRASSAVIKDVPSKAEVSEMSLVTLCLSIYPFRIHVTLSKYGQQPPHSSFLFFFVQLMIIHIKIGVFLKD